MNRQVDNAHYWTETYLCKERFGHLREQVVTILRLAPGSILEVGPGPGLLAAILPRMCAKMRTLDVAADTGADIVGDVTCMPVPDSSFELVCAFQMLEHIPWARLPQALAEMRRVSSRHVLFSVPDNTQMRRTLFAAEVSFMGHALRLCLARRSFRGLSNPAEHYWEIGVPPVTVDEVGATIGRSGLVCEKRWLDDANHYFLCSKTATERPAG